MPALLVDLDGTLVDTYPDLAAAARVVLTRHGHPFRPVPDARLRTGAGAAAILVAHGAPEPVPPAWIEELVAYYRRHCAERSRPFPGVERWFTLGPIAVVTNKPRPLAERVLAALFPERALFLVAPEDVGGRGKPAPDSVVLALERLGIQPTDAIFVGDDPRDFAAARAAGIARFLVAGYGYTHPDQWRGLATSGWLPTATALLHHVAGEGSTPR